MRTKLGFRRSTSKIEMMDCAKIDSTKVLGDFLCLGLREGALGFYSKKIQSRSLVDAAYLFAVRSTSPVPVSPENHRKHSRDK